MTPAQYALRCHLNAQAYDLIKLLVVPSAEMHA